MTQRYERREKLKEIPALRMHRKLWGLRTGAGLHTPPDSAVCGEPVNKQPVINEKRNHGPVDSDLHAYPPLRINATRESVLTY